MKQTRRTSRTGLLFASYETYCNRIWQAAYDMAIAEGKTKEEATTIADEAKKVAQEVKDGTVQNA